MTGKSLITPRTVAIALVAGAILVALVIASGGGLSTSSSPTPAPAPPATPVPAVSTAPPAPGGGLRGTVTVKVDHVSRTTWQFIYGVKNTGTVPIAGFELTDPLANLYHVGGRTDWAYYGGGVCGGNHPGVLIYWSTGGNSGYELPPNRTTHFRFTVNTTGTAVLHYSLSWGSAAPQFGTILGPAASSMPTTGPCSK